MKPLLMATDTYKASTAKTLHPISAFLGQICEIVYKIYNIYEKPQPWHDAVQQGQTQTQSQLPEAPSFQ